MKQNIDKSWYVKPNDVSEHDSAGGVVVRKENNKTYIATSHEIDMDDLTLPKGHVEKNETFEVASRREIEEETGLTNLKLITFLDTKERLNFEKTSWKKTHYFLFTTNQKVGIPTDKKHDKIVWLPLKECKKHLWPEQRDLIKENIEKIQSVFD